MERVKGSYLFQLQHWQWWDVVWWGWTDGRSLVCTMSVHLSEHGQPAV